MAVKRIYNIWYNMLRRTEDVTNKDYRYYGAKGIKVCEAWKDFKSFERWALANGYSEDLTIDRIDNSKDYSPENCRWRTRFEQNGNKTNTRYAYYKGKKYSYSELARMFGIPGDVLATRLDTYKWPIERALNQPVHRVRKSVSFNGKTQSVRKWALEFNIPYSTLKQRINNGIPIKMALGVL